MKARSIEEFVGLINRGFEGEVRFKGTISLSGNGITIATYEGNLVLKNQECKNDPRRYEAFSDDNRFNLLFAKKGEVRLEHPSEGASAIRIPILLPDGYFVGIHNFKQIFY
jgi:hypothetical protein